MLYIFTKLLDGKVFNENKQTKIFEYISIYNSQIIISLIAVRTVGNHQNGHLGIYPINHFPGMKSYLYHTSLKDYTDLQLQRTLLKVPSEPES